jgi:hypothetical protein
MVESRSKGEIAAYAAAVSAGLAMAGSADAAVIYSGVQNISVSIDPTLQTTAIGFSNYASKGIDLNGDGINDVELFAGFFARPVGSYVEKYVGGAVLFTTGGAAFAGEGQNGAFRLASSHTVGSNAFSAETAGRVRLQIAGASAGSISHTTYGNFPIGAPGFVGIRLANGDYGWIRIQLDDLGPNQPFKDALGACCDLPPFGDGSGFPDRITVIDWAYDDSGAPIHIEVPGGAPEPSSLALLAAGALGLAAFRRRKAAKPH